MAGRAGALAGWAALAAKYSTEQVMDAVREVPAHGKVKSVPLFPEISIGDSPIATKA